jgi:hypothetical protein
MAVSSASSGPDLSAVPGMRQDGGHEDSVSVTDSQPEVAVVRLRLMPSMTRLGQDHGLAVAMNLGNEI